MSTLKGQEEGEQILHSEDGIFLKGVFGSRMGKIILTDRRLTFMEVRHVAGVPGGLVGSLATKAVLSATGLDKKMKMSLPFEEIERFVQAKKGRNKNIMELTTKSGETFKISLGSEFTEWEERLNPHLK